MLVMRGNKSVAEIYLSEFHRLFAHYRFRYSLQLQPDQPTPGPETAVDAPIELDPTDTWWDKVLHRRWTSRSTQAAFRQLTASVECKAEGRRVTPEVDHRSTTRRRRAPDLTLPAAAQPRREPPCGRSSERARPRQPQFCGANIAFDSSSLEGPMGISDRAMWLRLELQLFRDKCREWPADRNMRRHGLAQRLHSLSQVILRPTQGKRRFPIPTFDRSRA
jgi:hypothetical protein